MSESVRSRRRLLRKKHWRKRSALDAPGTCAVDEATLIVRHKRVGSKDRWIKLVGGNGEDIISDWGVLAWGDPDGFAAFMESFDATENY